jgi:hypothetical protein
MQQVIIIERNVSNYTRRSHMYYVCNAQLRIFRSPDITSQSCSELLHQTAVSVPIRIARFFLVQHTEPGK